MGQNLRRRFLQGGAVALAESATSSPRVRRKCGASTQPMRSAAAIAALLLSACAAPPVAPPPADELYQDALFAPPRERIKPADIFAPSDAMRRFLREQLSG